VLGLRECVWLDAKGKPYKLGHPAQDAELCKDTTALANLKPRYSSPPKAGRHGDLIIARPRNYVSAHKYWASGLKSSLNVPGSLPSLPGSGLASPWLGAVRPVGMPGKLPWLTIAWTMREGEAEAART